MKANTDPFAITGSKKFSNYSVKDRSRRAWFDIDLALGQQKTNSSAGSLALPINAKVTSLWLAVLLFALLVLGLRTAYLQLVRGDYFSVVAEGNRIRIIDLKASRGVIYDRHQNLLVENVPNLSLALVPVDLPKEESTIKILAKELAKISDKSADEITGIIDEQSPYSYQPVILQDSLTQDQAIMTEIISSRYPGVILYTVSSRHYLTTKENPSLSHVLGYVGKIEEENLDEYLQQGYLIDDQVGKAGVELSYEKVLKGVNGREQVEVDAIGEAKEIIASEKPIPGKNLMLSIDSDLQSVAEDSLRRVLQSYGKKRGAVIVMDPNSGEILSMVSWPAFDNNLFSGGIGQDDFSRLINDENKPLFPRAISGEYPSGSTFKLIVGAAALEEGIINKNTGFNSVGGIAVSRWFFPDWKAGGHGWTTITKALAESVNTFFYIIGGGYQDFEGLGVTRIKEYAEKFGLTKRLGIDLPNEAEGFLPSIEWKESVKKERWYIGDTYNLSIGQGDILVTPLQLAAWTSVFANGGTLYQPYVVKEILDSDNNAIEAVNPKVLNQGFISAENIDIVNQGLRQAVIDGSAVRLYNLPIKAAAKTGTAQWSSKNPPHGWVTAFAPYDNPKVVVTVLVEEGEGGNTTAMPVTYDILNWWAENR